MLKTIFGNPHYKLASLLIAVFAWLYVQSDEVHDEQLKAHIEWKPPEGVQAVEPLPTGLTLRVRGTRSALRRAAESEIEVTVDIRDLEPGAHYLEFQPYPIEGLSGNIEVVGHTPAGIEFELDVVDTRKVRVKPLVVGEPASGYAVEGTVLTPATVDVRGPKVRLDSLGEIETEPIDVSALTGDAIVPVALNLPRGLEVAEGTQLSVEVKVLALKEERTFMAVPVFVWGAGYKPNPETVEVVLQGPTAALQALESSDIVGFAHAALDEGEARYEVAWGPPDGPRLRILHSGGEGVRVVSVEPPRMEIRR